MKLLSSANEYEAINLIKRDPRYSVYKCESKGRGYLLYLIADETLEKAPGTRFGKTSGSDFDGFEELFVDGDSLVLVFKDNALEETAADYLGGDADGSRKLMFFERVLEALCVHSVPPDIACDLLEHDNIGVKSDGSADCRYILCNISAFGKRGMDTLAEIFAQKLTLAFASAGRSKRTALIERFCGELRADPPASMTEFYDRYVGCVETCREVEPEENGIRRLKKKALKAAGVGKAILTVAVLGMAFLILIMSFAGSGSENDVKFGQIGDVVIEETSSQG